MSHLGKLCLAAGLLLPLAAQANDARPYEKASFYFAAHQDDWQLFMNPSAFQDVTGAKTKTVFVHLTAGDDGSGMGARGRKHPFYLARENGAEAAIRFMADANQMPVEKLAERKDLQRSLDLSRELSQHRFLFPACAGRKRQRHGVSGDRQ